MESSILGIYTRFSRPTTKDEFWKTLLDAGTFAHGMSPSRSGLKVTLPSPRWGESPSGMFFEDVDCFDRRLFSLAPASLVFADPRQRLLLEAVWRAIEDAGIQSSELSGKSVGVFVAHDGWYLGQYASGMLADRDSQEFYVPGNDPSFLANKISSTFNFVGPSIAFDTTCSGSLVALHYAHHALANEECDFAIVAAVSLFLQPWSEGSKTATPFESTNSYMNSFQDSANGYITSEGCGAILLTKEGGQFRDHESPYASILATGYNSGGKTASFAKPSPEKQVDLLRRILKQADVTPDQISYFEAHGVSSFAGDAIEGQAITEMLGSKGRKQPCIISCIKPNIGHTHCASGIYALLKVLLSFKNELIPEIRGFTPGKLNPEIPSNSSIKFIDEATQWRVGTNRRMAMIGSYGLSNVNASILIGDFFPSSKSIDIKLPNSKSLNQLICISATTIDQLRSYISDIHSFIVDKVEFNSNLSTLTLESFSYSLQVSRTTLQVKWTCEASSWKELSKNLTKYLESATGEFDGFFANEYYKLADTTQFFKNTNIDSDEITKISKDINKAITKRDFSKISMIWLSGNTVPWPKLYRIVPSVVNLPEYPFERTKYWIPKRFSSVTTNLLKDDVENSNSLKIVLSGNEYFLEDHMIQGKKILPAVVHLEFLINHISKNRNIFPIHLSNVVWERPILVDDSPVEILINQTPINSSQDDVQFEISSLSDNGEKKYLHSSGKSRLDKNLIAESFDFESLKEKLSSNIVYKEEIYNYPDSLRLDLGPRIRGIEQVRIGDNEILAEIKVPKIVENEPFILHPSIMDPILQVAYLGLSMRLSPGIPLTIPFNLKECTVYSPTSSHMWVWIRYAENSKPKDRIEKLDIDLFDETGKVSISMRGFSFRKLDKLGNFTSDRTDQSVSEVQGKKTNSSTNNSSTVSKNVEEYIRKIMSTHLCLMLDDIGINASFDTFGLDSILITRMTDELSKNISNVSRTIFFENQSLSELVADLLSNYAEDVQEAFGNNSHSVFEKNTIESDESPQNKNLLDKNNQEPIAIVGLSGKYPNADTLEEFWQLLRDGKDGIDLVPKDRWNWEEYYSNDRTLEGHHYSKWGGFISDIDKFDPLLFGISPKEAPFIDPQERLFLQCSWAALEDAGYSRSVISENPDVKTGVYAAVMYGQYQLLASDFNMRCKEKRTGFSSTLGSIANRVSYVFGFTGPSLTIDTQCSSSLTALHLACRDLRFGDTSLAIAGGVNITIHPNKYLELSRRQFISSKGHCESFGKGGDGYIPAEGVGVAVLKRLSNAIDDGDHIYGVILGSAINHGGKTSGFTVPNPKAQTEVIENAFKVAGVSPSDVSYIEAHGTGTALGDPIEINALSRVFKGSKTNKCKLGSVKSNIGHCESAAGIAGLTKVLLQLKHKQIVPSLHSDSLNPNIDFETLPFEVNQRLSPWSSIDTVDHTTNIDDTKSLIAGISSFGAGGSNAHIVIQGYDVKTVDSPAVDRYFFPFSAATADAFRQLIISYRNYLSNLKLTDTEPNYLWALSCTLHLGREELSERLIVVASSISELIQILTAIENQDEKTISRNCLFKEGWISLSKSILIDNIDFESDDSSTNIVRMNKSHYLWIYKGSVSLTNIWGNKLVKRISLPTYPFEKERYWIDDEVSSESNGRSGINRQSIHPLIHENLSNLFKLRYSSRFTGYEDLLEHHVIGSKKVLPGAVISHMFFIAAKLATNIDTKNNNQVMLHDLKWIRQAECQDDGLNILIDISATNSRLDADRSHIELSLTIYQIIDDRQVLVAETMADIGKNVGMLYKEETCNDDLITTSENIIVKSDEIYQEFDRLGIHFGSLFKLIDHVRVDSNGMSIFLKQDKGSLSSIKASDVFVEIFPDRAIDAAFQGSICSSIHKNGEFDSQIFLPYQVKQIIWTGSVDACKYIKITSLDSDLTSNNSTQVENPISSSQIYNILLMSENDDILLAINGFERRSIQSTSKITSTDLSRATVLAEQVWKSIPIELQNNFEGRQFRKNCKVVSFPDLPFEIGEKLLILKEDFYVDCNSKDWVEKNTATIYLRVYQEIRRIAIELNQFISFNKNFDKAIIQLIILDAFPWSMFSSLQAMLKSIELEIPQFSGQILLVRCDNEVMPKLTDVKKSLARMSEMDKSSCFRLIENKLEHQINTPIYFNNDNQLFKYSDVGCYILIGGAGGLGKQFAQEILSKTKRAQVVLIGRSQVSDSVNSLISESKGRLNYISSDVCDYSQIQETISEIRNSFGQIVGVIQLAGCTRDGLLSNKSSGDAWEVIKPKVLGTYNLDECTKNDPLDFFITFSSVAGVMGNLGQTDYSLANAYQVTYSSYRNSLQIKGSRQGRSLAICWPLMVDGGMTVTETLKMQLEQQLGMMPMPVDEATKALSLLLATDKDHAIISYGHEKKLAIWLGFANQEQPHMKVSRQSTDVLIPIVRKILVEGFIEILGIPENRIDLDEQTEKLGLDSVAITELVGYIQKRCATISSSSFYEFPTINKLVQHIVETFPEQIRSVCMGKKDITTDSTNSDSTITNNSSDKAENNSIPTNTIRSVLLDADLKQSENIPLNVAVIGMSGEFSGASNLIDLWENLMNGVDATRKPTRERLNLWGHTDGVDDSTTNSWGGYIEGIDEFDAKLFGINAADAAKMDPQERKILEHVWSAIEDAGYTPQDLGFHDNNHGVAVYVGAMYNQYQLYGKNESHAFASSLASIANRVSYQFDFKGPSLVVDSMCSSSASALDLACQALTSKRVSVAIVGGVNIASHPNKFSMLKQHGLLAETIKGQGFGTGTQGYVPGEGVGVLILKRHNEATSDRDNVYGVILGSSVSHTGLSNGYRVPEPGSEARVISEALQEAHVSTSEIDYIEAHSTGTKMGDEIELSALSKVFDKNTKLTEKCHVGSVKTNIGHCESAASVGAVIKVLLQLHYSKIPPVVYSNPDLLDSLPDTTNLKICTKQVNWPSKSNKLRVAGVSSFGAGGTNSHIVISDTLNGSANNYSKNIEKDNKCLVAIPFSAQSTQQLQNLIVNFEKYLKHCRKYGVEEKLTDISFTLWQGRVAMSHRVVILASGSKSLEYQLERLINNPTLIEHGKLFYPDSEFDSIQNSTREDISTEITFSASTEWLKGENVSWKDISTDEAFRVSLPTYSFCKTRFWWSDLDNIDVSEKVSVTDYVGEVWTTKSQENIIIALTECIFSIETDFDSNVLKPDVRIHDLMLDSLQIVRLIESWRLRNGTELLSIWFYELRTIGELVEKIESNCQILESNLNEVVSQNVTNSSGKITLTGLQQAFLFGRNVRTFGQYVSSNIYVEIECNELLDLERLKSTWDIIFKRHDMLHSHVTKDYQIEVIDSAELEYTYTLFSDLDFQSKRKTLSFSKINVHDWPPYKIDVSKVESEKFILHFVIDEVFADAYSVMLILKEWSALYLNPDKALRLLEYSYAEYRDVVEKIQSNSQFKTSMQYWINKLKKLPSGPSFYHDIKNDKLCEVHCIVRTIDEEEWSGIKALASRKSVYPSTLLLTIFCEEVSRITGQSSTSISLTNLNRLPINPDVMNLVGMFASSSIFVYEKNSDFDELLQASQEQIEDDAKHSIVSSVDVIRELRAKGNKNGTVELPVVFTSLISSIFNPSGLSGTWKVSNISNTTPQVCLDCQVLEIDGKLQIRWYISDSLINGNQINTLLSNFIKSLKLSARSGSSDALNKTNGVDDKSLKKTVEGDSKIESHALTDIQTSYAVARSGLITSPSSSHVLFQIEFIDFNKLQFEQIMTDVITSHSALSSIISTDGYQYKIIPAPFNFSEYTTVSSREEYDETCIRFKNKLHSEAIPLDKNCYIEASVVENKKQKTCVFLKVDFLVADGKSINIIVADLIGKYYKLGDSTTLSTSTYEQYLQARETYNTSPLDITAETYWKHKFQFISSGPTQIFESEKIDQKSYSLTSKLEILVELSNTANLIDVSLDSLLLYSYATVLSYWCNDEPFSLVVPSWDRQDVLEDVNSIVGDFTQLCWVEIDNHDESIVSKIQRIDTTLKLDQFYGKFESGMKFLRKHKNLRFPVVYTSVLESPEYLLNSRFGDTEGINCEIISATSNTANVLIDCIGKKISENELILQWDTKISNLKLVDDVFKKFIEQVSNLPDQILKIKKNDKSRHMIDSSSE